MTSETLRKVTAARSGLILDQPFFGALSLRLKVVEDSDCKTAWTDGTSLGFSPDFVSSLSHGELMGLVAHEVLHCACGHPWRKGQRDHGQWNKACDYAINDVLVDAGFILPDGALLSPAFAGKSAEWIYDRLPNSGDNDEQAGEVRDGQDDSQTAGDDSQLGKQDWVQATKQAAAIAAGTMSGSLSQFADKATKPPVNWRSVLKRFVQDLSKDDYTWSRPNTRYLCSGLYLPALHCETMGRIVIAKDISYSVDEVASSQFSAEISAIFDELKPSSIEVIYCDTEIQKHDVFESGDFLELEAIQGGGTDFRPVFDAIEDPPACLIYLTDLEGPLPDCPPDYPVLWAVTGERVAPWGETVAL